MKGWRIFVLLVAIWAAFTSVASGAAAVWFGVFASCESAQDCANLAAAAPLLGGLTGVMGLVAVACAVIALRKRPGR